MAYKHNGEIIDHFPASLRELSEVEPVYETFPGWLSRTDGIRSYADLPVNCRRYIERVAELCSARVGIVSVGAGRDETIFANDIW